MTFSLSYNCGRVSGLLLLFLFVTVHSPSVYGEPALRVTSLNLCYDDLVQRHSDTAALSVQPTYAHGGRIERIIRYAPDVVLANAFNDPMLINALRSLGMRVEILAEPQSLTEVSEFYQQLNQALGTSLTFSADNLTPLFAGQRVLMLQANHYSFGEETLWDELVSALGGHNVAPGSGLVNVLPEQVLRLDPDVLVVLGHSDFALAARNLLHRALAPLLSERALQVDTELVGCMAQRLDDLIAQLADAMEEPR